MEKKDFIGHLAHNLQPVKRLPSVGKRTLQISGATLFWLALVLIVIDVRADWPEKMMDAAFVVECCLLMCAGLAAAFAALFFSVPGNRFYSKAGLAGCVSVGLWVRYFVWYLMFVQMGDVHHFISHGHGINICLTSVATMAVVPSGMILWAIRKGAPCHPRLSGFFAVLSAVSFATIGSRYFCDIDNHAHVMLWHILPMACLALGGLLFAKSLLKW